jgi:O-antigen/teichoic acid export membrane protein
LPSRSISSRFLVSALVSLLRGGLSFVTTIVIARNFGPKEFGDYAFLLGTFVGVMSLLDLGTSNAFQTFISQKERGKMFFLSYVGWQLLQILLALLLIGIIIPEAWFEKIWLGYERKLVLLVLLAVFMQQSAWKTIVQIGESRRLTHRVQLTNLSIASVHLLLVTGCWIGGILSVQLVFGLILVEYFIFIAVASKVLSVFKIQSEEFDFRSTLQEYFAYCSPLVLYSILGFGYEFADRWLLQNYGGSVQQGVYEVGFRFGMASLLVTMSLHNIFWKEIAEANENKNYERIKKTYRKASRFVFSLGAFLGGFLIPWSDEIIKLMLGPSYLEGSPVFSVMLIFAAFRSLSILNGSMLLATCETKIYVKIGIIWMGLSMVGSYFILASKNAYLPGLQLGSLGLAIKMFLFSILHANVTSWWISRIHEWKFDWMYQIVVLGGALSCGWFSFKFVQSINNLITFNLLFNGLLTLLLYCVFFAVMIYWMPWVLGISRQELKSFFLKLVNLSRA